MYDPAGAEKRATEFAERVARNGRGFDHQPAIRKCLKCAAQFNSVGFHNRQCNKCRSKGAGLFGNVEYPTHWSDGNGEAALREGED